MRAAASDIDLMRIRHLHPHHPGLAAAHLPAFPLLVFLLWGSVYSILYASFSLSYRLSIALSQSQVFREEVFALYLVFTD
jgi:hypothetical protein